MFASYYGLISNPYDIGRLFCICESHAGMPNLALNRPAWQSSSWPRYASSADLAVDGNSTSDYHAGKTCSHTDTGDMDPWWAVDLGQPTRVAAVKLTGRADCCSSYYNFLSVTMHVIFVNSTFSTSPTPRANSPHSI